MPRHGGGHHGGGIFGGGHHHHHGGHHGGGIFGGNHHHPHHGGLGRAIVGGLVLGATAAALSSPRRRYSPVYVMPAPVIVTETPEQAAARIQAQRLREEARQRELERQWIEAEQRRAELERQRIEKERLENEVENARIENYKAHLQLINEAIALPYEALHMRILALPRLQDPIYRFRDSVYQGFPEEKMQNKNLLGCVLFNNQLYDNAKRELLGILINKTGYDRYAVKLFEQPLFGVMYNSADCLELMSHLYNNKFINKNILPLDTERAIWSRLFSLDRNNVPPLFNSLSDRTQKLQLLTDWINSQQRATDIIDVFNIINSRQIKLSHESVNAFNKIAKQRILQIEIAYRSAAHPGEDNERIHDFKNEHRGTLSKYFSCLFSPKSTKISRMISNGRTDRAVHEWNIENEKIHVEFYRPRHVK